VFAGCNPDGVGCFKSSGDLETISADLPEFNAIDVSGNIEVHLSNQPIQEVILTTGSNLIPGIRMEVVDGVLFLDNLNTCNWTRKYINPVVEISNPELTKIVQHGFGEIRSTETLTHNELVLENKDGAGDFILDVNVKILSVQSNEVANFYITGSADLLNVGFYYADEIFFGEGLKAINCYINHHGSNSMHLDVSGSLKGAIHSFGDVIVHNQLPTIIEVEEYADGKLIFIP
jgi:hypothetical protein